MAADDLTLRRVLELEVSSWERLAIVQALKFASTAMRISTRPGYPGVGSLLTERADEIDKLADRVSLAPFRAPERKP